MRRAVLLGVPETKRTVYMKKAAEREGVPLSVLDWDNWRDHLPEGELFLKIDPPRWDTGSLGDLERLTGFYERELGELSGLAEKRQAEYLNMPSAIAWLLHKRRCKERLMEAGLPVTEFLINDPEPPAEGAPGSVSGKGRISGRIRGMGRSGEPEAPAETASERGGTGGRIRNTEQLLEEMLRRRICQVFIKPVCGSGAAGVSAFRVQPGTGRMKLYTCAADMSGSGLVNTKRLRVYTEGEEIRRFLDQLLLMDCVVERWYAKDMCGIYSYDLRAVVQGGRMDRLVARLSRGPITNLQLNNHPLSEEEVGITSGQREMLEELCRKAAACFPGLWSVGLDILLEKGSRRPRILEMNAQGDLIYQDIYEENGIYRHQARRIKEWLSI